MADRSFKEYIGSRFYDQFFNAIKSYVIQNRHNIELSSRTVSSADYAELSDFEIKSVGIDDRDGMGIAFDVLVEAEVYVKEHHRHRDIDEDTCFPWFILSCTADLSRNMDDLCIHRVDQYNQRNKQNKPLSDSLVPISYKINLDKIATEFLRKHYPEALRTPMPIDPTVLADRLGLSVVTQELTEDFSVFGQIFFQDCDTEVFNSDTGEMEPAHFPAKTIVVDPKAFHLRNLGSVNNTIVHECVHWDQHRKAFELERLYNRDATQIKCLVIGGSKGSSDRTAADWMEWQANSLAPRIQMPIGSFKTKAAEFVRKFQRELKAAHIVDVMEAVIDALATFFVVSRHAAKMRMVDAGYEEAIGAFTYIDGHYVKPHAFKKGSLQKDQTYCISADDAQIIAFSDMRLAAQSQKGSYIYVDSHMCLNDPKYVTRDENNTVQMTDYGRLHIDECCLAFKLKIKATNKYGEEFYKECVLFRDVDSGIVFQTTFAKEASADVMGKADAILAREMEIQRVLQELPAQFGAALIYLMEWVEISEETLAEKALVSTKLVQRLRNNPAYPKNVDCVVAICIGMNLPPELSNALISRSGFALRLAQSEAHLMYNFFLNHLYMSSIHECNDMLVAKNLPVMTGTE